MPTLNSNPYPDKHDYGIPASDPASKAREGLRGAAISYVERRWFVVPLLGVDPKGTCRCRRGEDCSSAGKHPLGALAPHGWKDASCFMPTVGEMAPHETEREPWDRHWPQRLGKP
jgi:hypothetical protein